MDFTQSMDNGYMIPTSVAVGSGEATDIRCVCDTVEDFKAFLDTTGMELRYEGLVTYEKVNKLLKVYKGDNVWQTVGDSEVNVDTSSFITLTQLSQQLSDYYTKVQVDNKISEEIAKAQIGGDGEVDLSAKNEFYGKVANFLGDSQTEVNSHKAKIYHDWVKEYLGLSKVNNYGISSTTIAKKSSTDASAMCVRYANMDNTADLVCVMGGVNDVWFNSQMGAFGDTDPNTFYGAMEVLCDGLLTKYPGKTIIFITPTEQNHSGCNSANTTGYTATDFANAMKRVCAKYSIPVYDANTCSGIYPINEASSNLYTTDKLHLNDKANEVLGIKLAKFILNGSLVNTIIEDLPDNGGGLPDDDGGNGDIAKPTPPSASEFIGKTVSVTGLHDSGLFHFTALANAEGLKAGDVVEISGAFSNISGFAGTIDKNVPLFYDGTGENSNGKFTRTCSGAPSVTGDVSSFNLKYALNTDARSGEFIKIPIGLSSNNSSPSNSFKINSLSLKLKNEEVQILKVGSFFEQETFILE